MPENTGVSLETLASEGICRHDHLGLFYEKESELLSPMLSFVQNALALGERCILLNVAPDPLSRILAQLSSGVGGEGAVTALSAEESFLRFGRFNPEKVLRFIGSLCLAGSAEGFKGTRLVCDMGWVPRAANGCGDLSEFEAHLNYLAADHNLTLLCLYDRNVFPSEVMLELVKVHSHLHIGGRVCRNSYFIAPDLYLHSTRQSCELKILLEAVEQSAGLQTEQEQLRKELEQAHATLAQKICEVWREEDALRRSELQLHEKNEALQEYKRRIQTILQHIPLILGAFDGKTRLVACNHEYELVTGFRAEEVMGKRMVELLRPEPGAREEMVAAHPPEGGSYRDREWPINCKDGSVRQVSWSNISSFVRIPGWNNWIVGLDITQRVQAEHSLRVLHDELGRRLGQDPLAYPLPTLSDAGSPRQSIP